MQKILQNVRVGKELYEGLVDNYYENSVNGVIFLFSEYEEINFYTLYFLPIIKEQKKISRFVIVSPFENTQILVKKCVNVPYKFVICSKQEAYCVARFCQEMKPMEFEHVYINGSMDSVDNRFIELIGYNGISYKDVVAKAVYKFEQIPEKDEILSIKGTKARANLKKIHWLRMKDKIPNNFQRTTRFPDFIREELDNLIEKGSINKKDKVIIFSVTKTSQYIVEYLKDYEIVAILDNNEALKGTRVKDIPVYLPENFLNENHCDDYKIIVPTRSYKVICEQLYYLGYELGKQVFITYRDYRIIKFEENIKKGKILYDAIREKHRGTKVYLCPHPGTGDVYLIGMYLKERMKYDNVSECVVVVTSKSCKKIFELFGFDSFVKAVIVLNGREEGELLLIYARGLGYEEANVSVLNSDFSLVDLRFFGGYKGLDFNTLFQKTVFHSEKRYTYIQIKGISSDDIFSNYNLKKGKTILISPYANSTVKNISEKVWENLADRLNKAGYMVCTNVSDSSEQAIKGTVSVFVPYNQILDFLNKAGGFIGFRSGLCDIISSTSAKKVILYPTETFFKSSCSYYRFFSLEKMGFAIENLYEKEYIEEEWDITLDEIMEFFEK